MKPAESYTRLFDSILKEIKEDSDPVELNKLNKIIKKNVPFFLRKYFTGSRYNFIASLFFFSLFCTLA